MRAINAAVSAFLLLLLKGGTVLAQDGVRSLTIDGRTTLPIMVEVTPLYFRVNQADVSEDALPLLRGMTATLTP